MRERYALKMSVLALVSFFAVPVMAAAPAEIAEAEYDEVMSLEPDEAAVLDYTSRLRPPADKIAQEGWLNPDFPSYVRPPIPEPPPIPAMPEPPAMPAMPGMPQRLQTPSYPHR